MITRIITFMFVAVLALPIATLTPPGETGQASRSETAMAAKWKNHKHKKKDKRNNRRQTANRTQTVRVPVTQTFTSAVPFAILGDGYAESVASPYPGTIAVSGFTNGVVTDVNLVLTDLSHAYPDDLDLLLSASNGRRAFVMSDVGSNHPVTNLDLVLDDEAAAALPDDAPLSSGTFRPAIFGNTSDADEIFPAPAPTHNNTVALSAFDGADPNGTWQLWVMDDSSSDNGDLEGWALQITAEVDVEVPAEDADGKNGKKGKKHKNDRRGKKGKN
jgi:hypothetical protein